MIKEKIQQLDKKLKQRRLKDAQKSNKEYLLTITTLLIMGTAGTLFGITLNPVTHTAEINQAHYINGYHIEMMASGHPKMQGRTGYTNGDNTIYIQSGRKPVQIYRTCVHEIMHNKHPNMKHPEHNWWYNKKETTFNKVCIKLMAELDTQKNFLEKYGETLTSAY